MKLFALLSLLLILSAPFASFTYLGSFNGSVSSDQTDYYQFSVPSGLFYQSGVLYVADGGKGSLYLYNASGNRIKVITSQGGVPLQNPTHMAYDSGMLYIADGTSGNIMTYSGVGYNINNWVQSSNLAKPVGLALDNSSLYIVDAVQKQVITYIRSSKFFKGIAITSGPSDGQLLAPADIALYGGKFYVSDTGKNAIYVYDSNFTYLSTIGIGRGGVTLSSPRGIKAYDGRLYVADFANARVVVFSLDGYPIDVLDASTQNANLSRPEDIAIGDGNLYVADSNDRTVKMFSINSTLGNDTVLQSINEANASLQSLLSMQEVADKLNVTYESVTAAQDIAMALSDYQDYQFSPAASLAQTARAESDAASGVLGQDIRVAVLKIVKQSSDSVAAYRGSAVPGVSDLLSQFDGRVSDINLKLGQNFFGPAANSALMLPALAGQISSLVSGKQGEAASQQQNQTFASFSTDYSGLLARLNALNSKASAYRQTVDLSASENYLNQSLASAQSGDYSSANYSLAMARLEISSTELSLSSISQQIDASLANISSSESQFSELSDKGYLLPPDLAQERKAISDARENAYSSPQAAADSARAAVASAQTKSRDASSLSLAASAVLGIVLLIVVIAGAFYLHLRARKKRMKQAKAEEAEHAARAQERDRLAQRGKWSTGRSADQSEARKAGASHRGVREGGAAWQAEREREERKVEHEREAHHKK